MSGMGRASVLIGAGTVISRLTGFLRTVVLIAAVGATTSAGNAFAVANQLPNNVYAIISTGLLTAVIVPQIVKAATHKDGGQAFISKLFTLGTVVVLATTALATLAAPWLVQLYAPNFPPDQLALATAFAYWCLPQILFYGLYALVGEALNARRVYGPFTWAPIVNNVVSIAGFVAFIVLFGSVESINDWTGWMVAVLAGSATLGIVVQAVILMLFWPKAGLRARVDFRWRGMGLRHIGRLAGWTFLMMLVGQIAGLVQSRVVSEAAERYPGAMVSQASWLLFMLPYSIIVLSIGTPYFTQLSEHAAAGRDADVRTDLSRSIRTLSLFIVVATAALAVAAVPASRIFTNTRTEAVEASLVLLAYLVSLIPLSILFVIQRTFYAYNDTKTPFVFTLVQGGIVIATALIAQATVPVPMLAAGIALGQSLAITVQVVIATWLLRRRLGHLQIRTWMLSLGRFALAAVPAAGAGWLTFVLLGGVDGWTVSGPLFGALGAGIIGVVAIAVYGALLALFRTPELEPALALARRLVPGRK